MQKYQQFFLLHLSHYICQPAAETVNLKKNVQYIVILKKE